MDLCTKILVLCLMVAFTQINVIAGTGILEIQLESYKNPSKSLANRQCCHQGTSTCRIDCSNSFTICISSTSTPSCDVKTISVSGTVIGDDETFLVGKDEHRFQNPIKFKLREGFAKKSVYLSITVFHQRTSLAATFNSVVVSIDGTQSTWTSLASLVSTDRRRSNKKYLTLKTKTSCNTGYEGLLCDQKQCTPRDDDQGHYTCSFDKRIVCLPGWTDPASACTKKAILLTTAIILEPSVSSIIHQAASSVASTQLLSPETSSIPPESQSPIVTMVTSSPTNSLIKSENIVETTTLKHLIKTKVIGKITSSITTISEMVPHTTFASGYITTSRSEQQQQKTTAKIPQLRTISTYSVSSESQSPIITMITSSPTTKFLIKSETIEETTALKHVIKTRTEQQHHTTTARIPQLRTISTYSQNHQRESITKLHPTTTQSTEIVKSSMIGQHVTKPTTSQQTVDIRYTTVESNSNTFTIIISTVFSVALIGWLLVLLVIRNRLQAKAQIHAITHKTGVYEAPSPQECFERFSTSSTTSLVNDYPTGTNDVKEAKLITVQETSLHKSVPDH